MFLPPLGRRGRAKAKKMGAKAFKLMVYGQGTPCRKKLYKKWEIKKKEKKLNNSKDLVRDPISILTGDMSNVEREKGRTANQDDPYYTFATKYKKKATCRSVDDIKLQNKTHIYVKI